MKEPNPYESPSSLGRMGGRSSLARQWLGTSCSLASSLSSLSFLYLYGYWHWYQPPWAQSLPGRLGLSWIFAVEGSKTVSTLLAILSLAITIAVFRSRGSVQGGICLPTCALAVLCIGLRT